MTTGGILFVGSTGDKLFRAIEAKTGKQLWVTTLDPPSQRHPFTYRGKDGKHYVAIVATNTLAVFAWL